MCFMELESSLKAKKVGGVDQKVETVWGDQLSQLAPTWGRLTECGTFTYKSGESWEHRGLSSPLGLTSEENRLLKGESDVLEPFLGHWQVETPISPTSCCLGLLP